MPFNVLTEVQSVLPYFTNLYKEFHAHPELSMQEDWTAARIEEELATYGLSTQRVGGTGVVTCIENGEGPIIAFRADTDALPMTEKTGLEYASHRTVALETGTNTGVMHACGHDNHIASALAAAKILQENKDFWAGRVIFLFQPGEETAAGARAMVEDGLWEKFPRPEAIYGQHIGAGPAGAVMLSVGTAMSMANALKVTVHGKQAHGSRPEESIDPIVLAAYMITRLQTVVSREIGGADMGVVTVGTINSGTKENIIPESAEFTLNIRTQKEDVRATVLEAVERIIRAEAAASAAPEPEIDFVYEFPRCDNDPGLASELADVFQGHFGKENTHIVPPAAGSEDFGTLGDAIGVPYVFWFWGAYSPQFYAEGKTPYGNHSPYFAPDDPALALSTGIQAALVAMLSKLGKA